MKSILLPKLAFGESKARIDTSVVDMGERVAQVVTGLVEYDSLEKSAAFLARSAIVNINGLKIGSTSSQASMARVNRSHVTMLMIPLIGHATYQAEKQTIQMETNVSAAYLPKTDAYVEGVTRSTMMIEIDSKRLESTARGMLALEQDAPLNLSLDRPQQLQLQQGRISFGTIYQSMARVIDALMTQQDLLNHSQIDDNFYRTTAMLMLPASLANQEVIVDKQRTERLLDRACQYIQAHQDQTITLSALEHVSGLSERSLQLAFQKHYQCTPMQWVRTQRLTTARERLLHATIGTTVTAVALLCGFNKPSEFSHQYKLRFGELPSTTLQRSLSN